MNRISRRSAAETAEALLEAGRTEPVLHYDVESGLKRHHHWLRSEAPLPEWASASVRAATQSLVPLVVKTLVSTVLVGALGFAAWQTLSRPQPSAAGVGRSSRDAATPGAPSTRDVPASEAWIAPKPIPIPEPDGSSDSPAPRTVGADAHDKRASRVQRAHREQASARAASAARAETAVSRAATELPRSARDSRSVGTDARASDATDATSARAALAASAATPPSENRARATQDETVAASERKPNGAAEESTPKPAPQEQLPSDVVEMQQVATAEQLLKRSPERALALVRQGDQRFAHGYFQQERAYIAIMALIRLHRIDEARSRAASFSQQFPALPYGARIRSALEAAAPSAASRGAIP